MKSVLLTLFALIALSGCMDGLENKRADQEGNTVVGQSLARAKDEKCMENLRQIRLAIEVSRTSGEDTFPPDLKSLKLPAEMLHDPIDKVEYEYDPENGTVKCNHPGHKKY